MVHTKASKPWLVVDTFAVLSHTIITGHPLG